MSELGSEADQDRDDSGYCDEDRPRRRMKICMEYENGEKIFPLQRSLIGWVAGTSAGFERRSTYAAAKATAICGAGNHAKIKKLTRMKMAKAIRQQAATAERVAVNTANTYVANQMRSLAQAFRTQAEILKKNKKKKKK